MSYLINVAKRYGKDQFGNRYAFHCRIEPDATFEKDALAFFEEIKGFYPSPEYNVTLTERRTTSARIAEA